MTLTTVSTTVLYCDGESLHVLTHASSVSSTLGFGEFVSSVYFMRRYGQNIILG